MIIKDRKNRFTLSKLVKKYSLLYILTIYTLLIFVAGVFIVTSKDFRNHLYFIKSVFLRSLRSGPRKFLSTIYNSISFV